MSEIWKAIPGFEGAYEVSNLGRVRSVARSVHSTTKFGEPYSRFQPGREVAQQAHKNRYLLVHLYKDGQRKADTVHNLVAAAFLGPRPPGMQAAHEDGNPKNCRLDNLAYKTVIDNHADKRRHGTLLQGEQLHNAVLTEWDVRKIRECAHRSSDELATVFGVSRTCINHVRAGRTWKHV